MIRRVHGSCPWGGDNRFGLFMRPLTIEGNCDLGNEVGDIQGFLFLKGGGEFNDPCDEIGLTLQGDGCLLYLFGGILLG